MRVFPESRGPMFTWPHVEKVTGIQEALVVLQEEWILALATNAAESQEADIWRALERVGLEGLIERVFCYRMIGHKKPAIEYFQYILEDLKLEREDVVMVGDDFDADVLGANGCGVRAIWFNERGNEKRTSEMYRTIYGFHELAGELDLITR